MNSLVNVLGFGVMGLQIAAILEYIGYRVTVWSRQLEPTKKELCLKELRKVHKHFPDSAIPGGSFRHVEDFAFLEPALTYEVLVEDIEVKRCIISLLPYDVKEHGLLTNTSSYSPVEVAPTAVGLHFFNPAYLLKFAELSEGALGHTDEIGSLVDVLSSALGFQIIPVMANRGYIGNFLLFLEIANALKLIEQFKYKTTIIDQVLAHMGRTVSLFDIIDLVGVDVTRSIILNLRERDSSVYHSAFLDLAIQRNVLGRKNRTSIRPIIDGI